ncbi:RNA polymerase sigma-70 factor (ECF subfamily) [Pelomonas saccharophila]|uniref:RNA polymerase sigma-70 factor (ECF subfamily) n=1 Tax=Roseateles saccharophilus TaxID=304 RepID=A0ABU1YG23_ROSSA|nr:sigma-70 family RNA polymerase sigma factor [Roseateles saccharophilus]MDR7267795.1 RNA polymerase sigma-70 factor (ECF subfamily) [Roseateles saccharophilus]
MATAEDLPALMARVALGDRAAFERVYRATCAHLYSIALRTLRNEQKADEILQEAYVNIWRQAATFDARAGTPMTWMINVVRNKAIDAVRSRRTESAATVELDDAADELPADAAGEPGELLENSLAKARVQACMAGLPSSQRQALALAYYRGLVHTDIAAAMNAPLGTAKGWVRRGLEQLRACLEAVGMRQA